MVSKKVEEKLLACKTVWEFNEIAIENKDILPALANMPEHILEHYTRLYEEDLEESRKDPNYEVSPYNHSDPREAFEKRIYKSRNEDKGEKS